MTAPSGEGASAVDPKRMVGKGVDDRARTEPVTPVTTDNDVHDRRVEQRTSIKPAKTSPVAVFALIFGLSALFCVLTVVLSPVGIVLGVIGLVLGLIALRTTKKTGVTGHGVAVGGLVLTAIALILALLVAVGAVTFLNNDSAVNWFQDQVDQLRSNLPDDIDVPQP